MKFQLKTNEAPFGGLRRLLLEQGAHICKALKNKDFDTGVHEARKACKKSRAILRLLKPVLPAECKHENREFRNMARHLAAFRDRQVVFQSFDQLLTNRAKQTEKFRALRSKLEAAARQTKTNRDATDIVRQVGKMAEAACTRIKQWSFPTQDEWACLHQGVEECYRKGRKTLKHLGKEAPADEFHHWRKQVKDLGYYLRILRPCWPLVLKALGNELSRLGELLGAEHDLWMLQEAVNNPQPDLKGQGNDGRMELSPLLMKKARKLRQQACSLGWRVYAEKPKAFGQRLTTYVNAWQSRG